MRVAIVHYWLVGMGGGEKVLEAICRLYPQADIYTHALRPEAISDAIRSHRIRTTFINRLPLASRFYQTYLPLMPRALEQLDLTGYDLVISSESGPAKGVVTRADAAHVCYCHTPMRYLWDYWPQYLAGASLPKRIGMRFFLPYLRRWDVLSAFRVDKFIANSRTVARRIAKHWRREAAVVYPPVNISGFPVRTRPGGKYYICAGRLTPYKRVDLAIRACVRLGRKLLVVGDGEDMARLRALADGNVTFAGRLDESGLLDALAEARALIFPGEEDFGIVPVEAMASGLPVIAYGRGGATETVLHGSTGLFFEKQDTDSLCGAIMEFEAGEDGFLPEKARERAENFSADKFSQRFQAEIEKAVENREFAASEKPGNF